MLYFFLRAIEHFDDAAPQEDRGNEPVAHFLSQFIELVEYDTLELR